MPTFDSLISNPLKEAPAAKIFSELSTTLVFFINLIYIVVYGLLVIMVAYNLMKLAQKLIFADYEESYQKFKEGISNAVFAALGIVFIIGIRDLLALVLKLFGVADDINVFLVLPF